MATYEITGPDGNKYQVVGPEGASQEDVIKYVQSQMQGAQTLKKTSPEYPNLPEGQELNLSGGTLMRSDVQGVPGLRNLFPPTSESEAYAKAFPKSAAANQAIAGGLATAPLFAAAPELLPSVAIGGSINALDSATHGDTPGQIAGSAALGATTSALGYAGGGGVGRTITPHAATPEHQALVNTLQQEVPGVQLSAGQRTGSSALRFKEAEKGRAIDYNPDEPLQRSVTENLMTRIGHNPTLATQDEMNAANHGIGAVFQRVYGRNNLAIDPQLQNDVQQAYHNYQMVQPNSAMVPLYGNLAGNVANFQPGHVLSGETYGRTRSILAELERAPSSNAADAANSRMAGQLREALDDAFERSVAGNPNSAHALADVGALRQARQDYRNYLTIERAATSGSTASNQGYITPEALQTAVKQQEGRRAYATGRGDLSDLANAYAGVDRRLPFSGTSEYLKNMGLERNTALMLGGFGTGELAKDDESNWGKAAPLVGAVTGYGVGRGLNSAQAHMLFNPVMQRYLGNQAMTPWMQSILRAIGASTGSAATPQVKPSAQSLVDTLTGNKNAP